MDVSEKWGNDVETAVNLALADLKATRDEVTVTVLEEPSKGFFGIGAKLALVRVEKKAVEPEVPEKTPYTAVEKPVKKEKTEPKEVEKKKLKAEAPQKKEEPKNASKPIIEKNDIGNLHAVEDHIALDFLKEVAQQMGLELEISAQANDECIFVDIQGKDSGTIIGKRGQTLDAIQYLTSLVVNKENNDYVRVVVDAENYRSKREKTLEKLANRLADKVIKTKRSVRLEPMNPYERKVIHSTLQNNSRVTTRSEGQDPYRRVIIELK